MIDRWMAKPTDTNDKTQMLSESQVVSVSPTPPPSPRDDKNDRSVWKGLVVGADEFAPPPKRRSKRPLWIAAGLVGAGALAGGAYELYPRASTGAGSGSAMIAPGSGSAIAAGSAAVLPTAGPDAPELVPDAAIATAPVDAPLVDAGVVDAPPDAAPATPAVKKPVKKKVTKKLPPKKHH
jgi:hypothetical protein